MASNILSRVLPPATSPSVYETLRDYDQASDTDIEERAGVTFQDDLDEVPLGLDEALSNAMDTGEGLLSPSTAALNDGITTIPSRSQKRRLQRSGTRAIEPDEADDDVPLSLLIETDELGNPITAHSPGRGPPASQPPIPVMGQASGAIRAQWNATQEQQRLHENTPPRPLYTGGPRRRGGIVVDPREKAMWRWTNVQNLDNFLKDVYAYFEGKGIWSITLNRVLNLLTSAFVVGFSVFLTSCIDFSKLRDSKKMEDIYVNQCARNLSGMTYLLIWLSVFLWIYKLFQCIGDLRRLKQLHDFYHYLLEIPDIDIQTVAWQDVVKRLMALRDANPTTTAVISGRHRRFIGSQSKQRMDAHDIANRLMRRENYLIALFNKEILDLSVPIPFMKNRPIYSRSLEWTLSLCILDFIFDEQGQVSPLFLKEAQRKALSNGLRNRFFIIAIISIIVTPFTIAYNLALYFFRYFSEYQKDPSSIGSRQYTPYAEWKFREFNELRHLFERRMNMSYPFASRYINQFPKDKTVQLASFVAFVFGALAAVLAVTSLIDPDLFLGFEITPDKTVLFYLGVFTTVWAFARGIMPEEFLVFDPEYSLNAVINFTHYLPGHWKGRLHSDEVRREFVTFYQLRVVIFLEEILSMITTPFILFFSLPKSSERIVDFVREFTVHVDGLGYVCSFAVFDFAKGDNTQKQHQPLVGQNNPHAQLGGGPVTSDLRDDYYSTRDGKMLASYYNFMDHYVTNQKPTQQFQPGGKQFHPPPSFPALTSSHFAGGRTTEPWDNINTANNYNNNTRQLSARNASSRYASGAPLSSVSQLRTPRFAPTGGALPVQPSPLASILLDPQHQPAAGFNRRATVGQSRLLRASHRPISDLLEGNEDARIEEEEAHEDEDGEMRRRNSAVDMPTTQSTEADVGSQLGGSWKMSGVGASLKQDDEDDDDDDEYDDDEEDGIGGVGVGVGVDASGERRPRGETAPARSGPAAASTSRRKNGSSRNRAGAGQGSAGAKATRAPGSGGPAAAADQAQGQGILGLVYQFSKAQTEGRGAGAQI